MQCHLLHNSACMLSEQVLETAAMPCPLISPLQSCCWLCVWCQSISFRRNVCRIWPTHRWVVVPPRARVFPESQTHPTRGALCMFLQSCSSRRLRFGRGNSITLFQVSSWVTALPFSSVLSTSSGCSFRNEDKTLKCQRIALCQHSMGMKVAALSGTARKVITACKINHNCTIDASKPFLFGFLDGATVEE
jgi:hypothetical protein